MSDKKDFCKECINAKKKFRIGDKIILSVEGCQTFPEMIKKHKHIGVVVGFSRNHYNCARVLVNGNKIPTCYHSGFWERL